MTSQIAAHDRDRAVAEDGLYRYGQLDLSARLEVGSDNVAVLGEDAAHVAIR